MVDYLVSTDGLCKGNQNAGGQPGSWAFVVFDPKTGDEIGHKKGFRPTTTNNEMELYAVLEAIRWASKHKKTIHILSDSDYVVKGLNEWIKGWVRRDWKNTKGQRVKYREYWQECDKYLNETESVIEWVKGHAGNKYNEAADVYCNEVYFDHVH